MGRWAVFGLTAALAGLGGAWYLLQPRAEMTPLAPPPPAARPARPAAEVPAPRSRVSLPVSIPLASIADRLNREVPLVFRGREADPVRHRAVVDDSLEWVARRGPIGVSARQGRLELTVAAQGDARVRGRVRVLGGALGGILRRATGGAPVLPFDVDAEAAITLGATLSPRLQADWHIRPNAHASVVVHRAEVPIAGLATVSVRDQVRAALEKKIGHLMDALEQAALRDDRLRRLAAREWGRLHKVERLSEAPDAWLVVKPVGVEASQVHVGAQSVDLGVAIEAETRVVFGDRPPDSPSGPLPPLRLTTGQTGELRLNAPAAIPWAQINAAIARRLGDLRLDGGAGTTLVVHRAECSPWGEGILLTLDLEAAQGRWLRAGGRVYLTASPRLDAETRVLHLDGLDFGIETRDTLAAAAGWLITAPILERLRAAAAIDVSPYVARAREAAERAVERFVADAPDGVRLAADLREFAVGDVAVTAEDLRFTVVARAGLSATVTRLPL